MVMFIQVIGILFGVFMLYTTFLHLKKEEFTLKECAVWSFIWVLFIFVSLIPTVLDNFISGVLHFSRRLDFFITVSIIFMMGVLYYMYGIVRANQHSVEKIVRHISLQETKKRKK